MANKSFDPQIGQRARRGATALEYVLLLAFGAVAVVAAFNRLPGEVKARFAALGQPVQAAPATSRDAAAFPD